MYLSLVSSTKGTLILKQFDGSPVQTFSYGAGTTAFSETHQYLDDNPSSTASDTYAITATLADDDSGSDTAVVNVTVNNVAPIITNLVSSALEIGDGAEQQLVTISGAFTDIGTLDTHIATIDWGDGTTSEAVITEKDGSGLLSNSHRYINGGIYDVKVSLSDDDNGSITQSTKAMITGVGVKDGTLYIIGTDSADHVSVNRDRKGLKVHADFLPDHGHFRTFNAAEIQRIEIYLGDGNDHATIADNIDLPVLMDGGAGNDHLNAGRGPAVLIGGEGNDKLIGSRANDKIFGGNGNDVIFGFGGNDLLDGGAGNDIIFGSCGADEILGGDGKDVIFGEGGNDTIDAGAGNDLVFGGWGHDTITGGAGNDVIFGGSGRDKLYGGDGNDRLYGVSGNDVLDGGDGNDRLFGGSGNDILIGGEGHDRLKGGCGRDILIDSTPSWVRQFVVDLANYDLDPNGDISIVIPSSLDPQLPSYG